MEAIKIKAEARQVRGSRAVTRLRNRGLMPAIIYGHKKDPQPVALDRREMQKHIDHGAHLVELLLGSKSETCLIRDVQFDHLGITALHVDFARVDLNERVRVKVHLELKGTAKGIADGGVVSQQLMDMDVECLVTAIPEAIRVNIADLALNQVLHVRDVPLPDGVRALIDGEIIVAMCREPLVQAEAEATPAAEGAAAEPEVIAKGKIEEEGEGEAEKK